MCCPCAAQQCGSMLRAPRVGWRPPTAAAGTAHVAAGRAAGQLEENGGRGGSKGGRASARVPPIIKRTGCSPTGAWGCARHSSTHHGARASGVGAVAPRRALAHTVALAGSGIEGTELAVAAAGVGWGARAAHGGGISGCGRSGAWVGLAAAWCHDGMHSVVAATCVPALLCTRSRPPGPMPRRQTPTPRHATHSALTPRRSRTRRPHQARCRWACGT